MLLDTTDKDGPRVEPDPGKPDERAGRRASKTDLAGFRAPFAAMVLVAPVAHGALPPEYYQAAREQAPHHLQLRVERVKIPRGRDSGNCQVEASVLRDFRGSLAAGTPLHFLLNCRMPDARPRPGASAWHGYESLESARFAEGFFRGTGATVVPVYGQLGIVAHEREWPWCEAGSGRCDLPPPEPPQVLECGTVGLGGTGKQLRGGWVVKIADYRMWFWSDVEHLYTGEGRHWQPHLWEPQRLPVPLRMDASRYTQVSHLYTEGGEQLLMTRSFSYDRSTGRFEERTITHQGVGEDVVHGACRPIADPDTMTAPG
ncbi:hypothetical protein [Pseudoxanthomonas daejeonensis]|uniref:Uncharacterized protein n=1 Tax=Pseudoxanthomonas daejeonensis TaxID=266062 RepID=A0ABQ6Z6W7_9GAMM|nr:hypothetical protein [Pseudoxanthomonas daejeonensis]KAF1694409.1 hypothetical protein CSC65_09525 [Pseudoxanthomonas daejeonensis]